SLDIEDRGAGEGNLRALKAAFKTKSENVPNTFNERGRGVFLIRSLMDHSELKLTKKGGVRIIMVKTRKP
ncbi:MAG: ATP-binding protein, partial [Planctomycetes bacterium]|nr:ATP-binding protein [Planctomycetota bacterium]